MKSQEILKEKIEEIAKYIEDNRKIPMSDIDSYQIKLQVLKDIYGKSLEQVKSEYIDAHALDHELKTAQRLVDPNLIAPNYPLDSNWTRLNTLLYVLRNDDPLDDIFP